MTATRGKVPLTCKSLSLVWFSAAWQAIPADLLFSLKQTSNSLSRSIKGVGVDFAQSFWGRLWVSARASVSLCPFTSSSSLQECWFVEVANVWLISLWNSFLAAFGVATKPLLSRASSASNVVANDIFGSDILGDCKLFSCSKPAVNKSILCDISTKPFLTSSLVLFRSHSWPQLHLQRIVLSKLLGLASGTSLAGLLSVGRDCLGTGGVKELAFSLCWPVERSFGELLRFCKKDWLITIQIKKHKKEIIRI